MHWILERGKGDGYTPGKLWLDKTEHVAGRLLCYTLERAADDPKYPRVPAGTYKLALTESARARRGSLWTPDQMFRLPLLVDVPGREGIRIHAGNLVGDTEGCILVGLGRVGNALNHSRDALKAVIALWDDPCTLEIKETA